MSSKILSIAMMGKNRIGLISDLTKYIYTNGANIHKSRMVGYSGSFIISLKANVPVHFNFNNLQHTFQNELEIFNTTNITELDNLYKSTKKDTYNAKISVSLADTPGIIHNTAYVLANNNININELRSDIDAGAFTNTPLFKLDIDASIPNKINIGELYTKIYDNTELQGVISISHI